MERSLLILAASLPGAAAALSNDVSTPFTLSEGNFPFKDPADQITNGFDGFQWKEAEREDGFFSQYYYYYEYDDVMDYYRGSGEYFDYYYNELEDEVAQNQMQLIVGGAVDPGFQCRGNDDLDEVFIDPVFIDTRRLEISVSYYYATWSNTADEMMDNFRWGEDDYEYYEYFDYDYYEYYDYENLNTAEGDLAIDVWLKSVVAADISDSLAKIGKTGTWRIPSTLLHVKPIPHAEQMHAEGHKVETGLAFEYECFGTGQTLVQVQLTVKTETSVKQDICVNWIKQCSMTLPYMWIMDDSLEDVVLDNKVVYNSSLLVKEPVKDMHTLLYVRLMQEGTIRIRHPDIYSGKTQIGDVDLRLEDEENPWLDVSQTRSRISIAYTCFDKGTFPVHMLLQRDWSSYTEIVAVHWTKTCAAAGQGGDAPLASVEASVFSATYENKSLAVTGGAALPGFKRPCPRPGIARTRHKDEEHKSTEYRPPPKTCNNEVPKFIVPRTDKVTVLEWKWDSTENPQFEDSIVGYNPRLMEAKISNDWKEKKSRVSYVCFANGLGNVTVTVYLAGRPPLDIAWRKMCTEPTAPHTGKALTATLAFSLIAIVFTLCGVVVGGICYYCRKSSHKEIGNDMEIASIVGRGREEVTFND